MRRAVFLIVALLLAAGCQAATEKSGKEPEQETPAAAEPGAQETQAEPEFEPEAQPVVRPEPEGEAQVHHVVQKGETLWRIGQTYGVAWEEIAKANGIDNVSALKVGTKLVIPGAKKQPEGK